MRVRRGRNGPWRQRNPRPHESTAEHCLANVLDSYTYPSTTAPTLLRSQGRYVVSKSQRGPAYMLRLWPAKNAPLGRHFIYIKGKRREYPSLGSLLELPVGTYKIEIMSDGYAPFVREVVVTEESKGIEDLEVELQPLQ